MKGITMTDKLVFLEIEPPVQYSELSPGMYAVNCPGRFDAEEAQDIMQCAAHFRDVGLFNGTFLGIMLPFYLHNANNLLVGVLGNLDLAGMFMPDIEKVEPKIAGARSATGSVVDYFREIAGAIPSCEGLSFDGDAIGKCLTLLKAACGRSVNSEGLDELDLSGSFNRQHPAKAVAVLNGMAVWTVVSLGGSGTVSGSILDGKIQLKWSKPEGPGLLYMPGSENSSSILAVTGGLAASAGMVLVVENWTEDGGEVTLVAKQ